MQDLLAETVELQRIVLFAKLMASSECSSSEKELALQWLGEMAGELDKKLKRYSSEIKNPQERGHDSHGRRGFQ
ncbi:hypothetical protein ACTEV4_000061 [Cronobacter turicensis]|uniref:hypothetical protein n=1 Tax=Franconibacter pulveris TaxID=435910 RepID=UPI0008FF633A|nr:hypothetical protein [Franconibacter pulveris]EGT5208992.1 hypothetical protein [Cronobacter sakazakii]EMA8648082.1 hypothetical protein [Cronobacter turicensis]EGT5754742.1 hypothetical protein [Cronobacter sakazakii]EJG0818352.1 hypothetical protein [Cronobacter sakazakii]EJG2181061.1 hypothetical protein [Cronobacter sakazakii]